MTKKQVLQHIIDIFYEQLLVDQINAQYIADKAKDLDATGHLDYQAKRAEYMQNMEVRTKQIEIAKKMLKEL